MGINPKQWLGIGSKVASVIIKLVRGAEGTDATGQEKRNAVLDAIVPAVQAAIPVAELAAGKDFLNDEKVVEAAGAYVDAYVALQNAISATIAARKVS